MRKPSIIEFVTDPNLLGLSLSEAQEALLRGIYGLPLLGDEQRELWQLCTERPYREGHQYPEAMVISGARGGKDSRIAAPIVCYEAVFGGHETRVAKGERGTIVLVAQDAKAVTIAFNYIKDYLAQSPVLSQMLAGEPLAASLMLTNGLEIKCFPCTLRSMRGYSIPVAVMDEVAFFALEGMADSDQEIQTSIRRGMVGFKSGTKLIKISTPYMRGGILYDDFQRAFAKPDPDLLVWRATSRLMNPVTFSAERLGREERLNPLHFRREYLAEWVDALNSFLPQHLIDLAAAGRELPPRDGVRYTMAVDPSGGGDNHYTAAIVHTEGRGADLRVVQDVLRGRATRGEATIDLEAVTAEYAALARRYGLRKVYSDRYSKEWVAQAWKRHGLDFDTEHGLTASDAYLESERLFTEGRITVVDDPVLRRELACLEKTPLAGGKFRVDHPHSHGSHADYANATCLAAAIAARQRPKMFAYLAEAAQRAEAWRAPAETEEERREREALSRQQQEAHRQWLTAFRQRISDYRRAHGGVLPSDLAQLAREGTLVARDGSPTGAAYYLCRRCAVEFISYTSPSTIRHMNCGSACPRAERARPEERPAGRPWFCPNCATKFWGDDRTACPVCGFDEIVNILEPSPATAPPPPPQEPKRACARCNGVVLVDGVVMDGGICQHCAAKDAAAKKAAASKSLADAMLHGTPYVPAQAPRVCSNRTFDYPAEVGAWGACPKCGRIER